MENIKITSTRSINHNKVSKGVFRYNRTNGGWYIAFPRRSTSTLNFINIPDGEKNEITNVLSQRGIPVGVTI